MVLFLGRVLAAAIFAAALGASPQQAKNTTVVLGRVVEGLSEIGVADALVQIRGTAEPFLRASALTNASGDFLFVNLPPGSYALQASRDGYWFGEFGQRRIGGRGRSIIVSADRHVTDVRVPIWRQAAVSGVVLDDAGEPVTGVSVQAMSAFASGGGQVRMSTPSRVVQTDDRGAFRLYAVPPGAAVLSIPAAELASVAPRSASPNASGELAYAPVFFPSGPLSGAASALTLAAGEERLGINLRLQLTRTRRVSGRVTGPGDLGGILVRLTRENDRFFEDPVFAETVTRPDGRFLFERVIPGEYVARVFETSAAPSSGGFRSSDESAPVSVPRPPRAAAVFGSAPVVVADANVDGVDIALQPGARITGQVVFNGNAPKPRLNEIALYLQPEPSSGRRVSPRTSGTADADFTFQTGEITYGRYFVRWPAGVRSGWTIETITWNGFDAIDKPIAVLGSDAGGVVVTLTDRISEVTGAVRSASNNPDLDAAVIVLPADQTLWSDYGFYSPRLRYARVDLSGNYVIRGLPAGDYLAFALDDALTEMWETRAFLERWSRGASRFTIAIGAKQTLDLRTTEAR